MRQIPKSIQEDLSRIWESTSYLRRITTSRARMMWCVRLIVPARIRAGGAAALDLWWLTHHFWITDHARKARRKRGLGNVFLLRCDDQALLLTNGSKSFAFDLLTTVRREVFWEKFHSLPHMSLHHIRDGVPFHDLWIQLRQPNLGGKHRLFVQPSESTIKEFRHAVRNLSRVREGQGRWARKPRTIVEQYNAFMASWWARYRYADWDVVSIAGPRGPRQRPEYELLERWARRRLYYKVRQEVARRNGRRLAWAREKGLPTDKLIPAHIKDPQAFAAALYRKAARFGEGRGPRARATRVWLGARKLWRLGQEPCEGVPVSPPTSPSESTDEEAA